MGRKTIYLNEKIKAISIYLPIHLYEELEKRNVKNKSKLFQWILEQYFNEIK